MPSGTTAHLAADDEVASLDPDPAEPATRPFSGESHGFSLSNPRRRSKCCRAPIIEPFPMGSKLLARALALQCTDCGRYAAEFEVVTADGTVIWPVPADFDGHWTPSNRGLSAGTTISGVYSVSFPHSRRIFR